DEPTSPKKPKSVSEPEPDDVDGGVTSPLPSEWTSVRISPEEDVVGQDVLAVCVLVTSDNSSSDTESVCGGSEDSGTEPCEERPRQLEPSPLPLEPPPQPRLLSRHSSLREAPTRADSPPSPEESKAVHALHRAKSIQSPTSNIYQSWRRKFQSRNVFSVFILTVFCFIFPTIFFSQCLGECLGWLLHASGKCL
ncbi:hypothetical protein J0S82_009536, partial [Galemys pyrenaicus]